MATKDLATVTVKFLIESGYLGNAEVLAGSRGLRRRVQHITVLSTPDPWDWLKGNELVLTTGYFANRDPQLFRDVFQRLLEKDISAFCFKEGRYMPPLSDEILALAEKNNVPLIRLAKETAWTDILDPVYTLLSQANEASAKETKARTTRLFLHNLLDQPLHTLAEATAMAESFGLSVHPGYLLFLTYWNSPKRDLSRTLKEHLEQLGPDSVALKHNSHLVVIVPHRNSNLHISSIQKEAQKVLKILAESGYSLSYPLLYPSAVADLNELKENYIEAAIRLKDFCPQNGKNSQIAERYKTSTALGFLLSTQDPSFVESYCERHLAPLVIYEKHESVMMETFKVYVQTNSSIKKTADLLSIHPSTVKYRLNKLNKILDLNPGSFDDKMELYIAMKAWQALPDIRSDSN